uniref:hypothetical protein n=1 Tax=Phytobacter sp. V91 TaxID=3369425 RepID=UPI003F63BD3E
LGGSWFVGAFEALTLKPPALPEDTYWQVGIISDMKEIARIRGLCHLLRNGDVDKINHQA